MTVLVSDSFNRADNTTSLGTTDSYNGGTATAWQIFGPPTYGVISNQAYMPSNGGEINKQFAGINVSNANVKVTCTFTTNISNSSILILRAVSTTSFLMLQNKTSNYTLYYYNGSTWTSLGTAAVTPANNDVIVATLNGSSITININGVDKITVTSTQNQTATIHGFSASGSTAARFDNFQIEDIATGTTYTGAGTAQGAAVLQSSEHYWYNALGTVQGYANVTSSEHYIYSAIGTAQGISALSSNEKMLYSALGTALGYSAMTAQDIVTMMASGIAQGYTDITNIQPQLVSIVRLIGKQELTIILTGQESIDTVLKGQQIVNVNLKGVFK